MKKSLTLFLLIASSLTADAQHRQFDASYPDVHDPVMAQGEDGRYYIFSTGMGVHVMSSADMKVWQREQPVFSAPQSWVEEMVPSYMGHWAPDISYHDGLWRLYYSCSTFGRNGSAIGLATSRSLDPTSPDFGWQDQGLVIASHRNQDDWNAIDPNLIVTPEGERYLVYGSFWDGIQLIRLDSDYKTPLTQPKTVARRLDHSVELGEIPFSVEAGRDTIEAGENAIEAPFIIYHDGYYYLFVSFDYCCRGANSTYRTVYGRARSVEGPYLDKAGKCMEQGGGTLLVGPTTRYYGRGHNGIFHASDDTWRFVCHAYDAEFGARSKLYIRPFYFDRDGWIVMQDDESQKTVQYDLPNPLLWQNGQGEVKSLEEWSKRRNEISELIQEHEIGIIPSVSRDQITARMDGDTLLVTVTVGKESLTLSSLITYPEVGGNGPFPLLIGSSHISLPKEILASRPIATMDFHERQVNGYSQFRGDTCKANYGFLRLYPELWDNGAYSMWAWGFQRLIDGLEILGPEKTHIDTQHIGVTGCSYAGKMALFCGAFDPRVCLTIAQEPGGGGAAAWRVSHELDGVEDLDRTDYHWFKESLREQFHGDSVYQLPYDHHELCALVCPRAFLMLGNTDYKWLADESGYVSVNAAKRVWEKLGVSDRMGYSILGGHPHCVLPQEQFPELEAFIDRFLLDKPADTSNVGKAAMFEGNVDLSKWIKY